MKRQFIKALLILLVIISACNKEEDIVLSGGLELIPGEYQGIVRVRASQDVSAVEYELTANIEYIDPYNYLITTEDHDAFSLPILQLRIVEAHHIWAYIDVVENDFYEENTNTNETNRFEIIHREDGEQGIMIQDEQIRLKISLHKIASDSAVNLYFYKDL